MATTFGMSSAVLDKMFKSVLFMLGFENKTSFSTIELFIISSNSSSS